MTPIVRGYHAHIYFDAASVEVARALCAAAAAQLPVQVGRFNERAVGPHLAWSCQIAFAPNEFGTVIPWLAMHRGGLVVFVHPISDNELIDHRDRAIWMGAVCELKLDVLLDGPTDDLL